MSSAVVWLIPVNASICLMVLTSFLSTLSGAKNAWGSLSHMLHKHIRSVHLEIVLNRKTVIFLYPINNNHLGSHMRENLLSSRKRLLLGEVMEEKPATNTNREKSATQQTKIISELFSSGC